MRSDKDMKICDLHTHSYYSDGSLSPAELVALAEKRGLCAVALTDHNTAKGLREFMDAGNTRDVITVPGCEFSTEYLGSEIHIVGLFFGEKTWSDIEDYVDVLRRNKKKSNQDLIKRLNDAGYDITYEEAAAITDADEFNRAHVARVLCGKGYFEKPADVFKEVLKEGGRFYVPPKRPDVFKTIRFINEKGAVSVLAHPYLNLSHEELQRFLPKAKEAGLIAIETGYSAFDEAATKAAEHLAWQFGLIRSGGSDFHGDAKPDVELGTGYGNLEVPFEYYQKLSAQKG